MNRKPGPVTTTVGLGLICAAGFIPLKALPLLFVAPVTALEWYVALTLAAYARLLAGWSDKRYAFSFFPLSLLLVLIVTGSSLNVYLPVCLVVLSWIRSGIYFNDGFHVRLVAELLLCGGGAMPAVCWVPDTDIGRAVGIWLFFLVQALYFPLLQKDGCQPDEGTGCDSFERARLQAERILKGR